MTVLTVVLILLLTISFVSYLMIGNLRDIEKAHVMRVERNLKKEEDSFLTWVAINADMYKEE